ncbi:hypothetical protein DX130_21645 [Paenibacillus paeoniae]|uniref:Uncharacterized protein n=1 Tax=Paenibacillus paeoniae TaxID=2292705 RepID=A0A371P6S5_9BACL|nr:hypothetical protein DX130_21645 [Paenibacillus paeoniae]
MLPNLLIRNISFLKNFLKERAYYSSWKERVIYRLICLESCTVDELAYSFEDEFHPLLVKPLIFHLIAIGNFHTEVNQTVGSESMITINSLMNPLLIHENRVMSDVH